MFFQKSLKKRIGLLLTVTCVLSGMWCPYPVQAEPSVSDAIPEVILDYDEEEKEILTTVWESSETLARAELSDLLAEREIMAVVYLTDGYEVRKAPNLTAEAVATVHSGQTVFVQDVELDEDSVAWVKVSFSLSGQDEVGYIERPYLACSEERFLAWEEKWHLGYQSEPVRYAITPQNGVNVSSYPDVNQFPESYRVSLDALKQAHPNWMFVPLNTGLDWNTAVSQEMLGGKSLVSKTYPNFEKEGAYDDNNWFYASREVLSFYMDPRNSLNENHIFQFEQLTFNDSYHTEEALDLFLSQTFMNSNQVAPGTVLTYKTIFFSVGKADGFRVSPFHLAARVYQEQGQGTSPLISGTYPGYEGLYNYFNVGATGKTTTEVIVNGLQYAKTAKSVDNPNVIQPWNNAYYSILGGAYHISANYIRKGQDTLYLQKFNVNPAGTYALYSHQYMQNIAASYNEATKVKNMYAGANSLECPFVFTIPVFNNMPAAACQRLTSSNQITVKVPTGADNTTLYVDGKPVTAAVRNGYSILTAPTATATSLATYQYDAAGKPIALYSWTLQYSNGAYTVSAQPTQQMLYNLVAVKVPAGFDASAIYIDGVAVRPSVLNGYSILGAAATASTAVVYQYNASGVPVDMYVWTLENTNGFFTATPQPGLQNLLSYHGFSIRITGKSGIRFKTGISTALRNQLTTTGVSGYQLKEYGTLVMNKANMTQYPFIKGGAKVSSGMSYGVNVSGVLEDNVYETVADRYRFASVLVGIPAAQYKTEFAFRGYAILEKDGKQIIVYGPAVAKSIYALANQVLAAKTYPEGSDADLFLKKLVADAL